MSSRYRFFMVFNMLFILFMETAVGAVCENLERPLPQCHLFPGPINSRTSVTLPQYTGSLITGRIHSPRVTGGWPPPTNISGVKPEVAVLPPFPLLPNTNHKIINARTQLSDLEYGTVHINNGRHIRFSAQECSAYGGKIMVIKNIIDTTYNAATTYEFDEGDYWIDSWDLNSGYRQRNKSLTIITHGMVRFFIHRNFTININRFITINPIQSRAYLFTYGSFSLYGANEGGANVNFNDAVYVYAKGKLTISPRGAMAIKGGVTSELEVTFGGSSNAHYYSTSHNKDGYGNICIEPPLVFDGWDTYLGNRLPDMMHRTLSTKIASRKFELWVAAIDSTSNHLKKPKLDIEIGLYETYRDQHNRLMVDKYKPVSKRKHIINFKNNPMQKINFMVDTAKRKVALGFLTCSTISMQGNRNVLSMASDNRECEYKSHVSCYTVTNSPHFRLCSSTDNFAIRPKSFENGKITEDLKLLRSGRSYSVSGITAVDNNNSQTIKYNQFIRNLQALSIKYLATGAVDISHKLHGAMRVQTANAVTFSDGILPQDINLSYDDIGDIAMKVYDKEWASVDQNQSPDTCNNIIEPYGVRVCSPEMNMTFIPDHFDVVDLNVSNHNDGNFTYLTYLNDLNMSVHLGVTINAMNAQGTIVQNFRQGMEYYENPLSIIFTVPAKDINGSDINLTIMRKDISTPMKLGFGGNDANGTHKIKWDDLNISQRLMFNYNKKLNIPKNPFDINGSDINLTASSLYLGKGSASTMIMGTNNATGTARLYYAAIRSSKDFYENITTSSKKNPILITIYCNLQPSRQCTQYGFDTTPKGQTNTSGDGWYLSLGHRQDQGYGDIVLKIEDPPLIEGAGNPTIDSKEYPNIIDVNITVNNLGKKDVNISCGSHPLLPMTVGIELVKRGDVGVTRFTSDWLVHNKNDPIVYPSPLFKDRFIGGASDWAGVGKTGYAVDIPMSAPPNKRMNW